MLDCRCDSLSSFLPGSALPPEQRTVCASSPFSALWLVRLVRKPTLHCLVSAQVHLHRAHGAQCRIFQLVFLSSYMVDSLFEEQMLSSEGPLCAKDTPYIPPPSYSF